MSNLAFGLHVQTAEEYNSAATDLGVEVADRLLDATQAAGEDETAQYTACIEVVSDIATNGNPRTKGAGAAESVRTTI